MTAPQTPSLAQIVADRDRERLAMLLHDAFFANEHTGLMGCPLWLAVADSLLVGSERSR